MTTRTDQPAGEVISARATVTLDARALDELGSATIDRLADLVANRLAERRMAGEAPLLTVSDAARVAGVHPETVRRAIKTGVLEAAGYVGKRPRLRREDVERWLSDSGETDRAATSSGVPARSSRRRARPDRPRVLGNALTAALNERERS